jgi:hypothetical protein
MHNDIDFVGARLAREGDVSVDDDGGWKLPFAGKPRSYSDRAQTKTPRSMIGAFFYGRRAG